jgi:malate dehydrogenase (oxaloacetate-decarboxylating)(NADP+)
VGLGAVAAGALTISDDDFAVAAECLASQVSADQLAQGCAYPPLSDIRTVSLKIAAAVAYNVVKDGRADPAVSNGPGDYDSMYSLCEKMMYNAEYKL